jgi:membrane associated rhomboid family serine protease
VGDRSRGLVGLIAINLAFGFLMPGVSWQAHLGGLLAGGAMTAVFTTSRSSKQAQLLGGVMVALVFVGLTIYRMNTMLLG